MILSDLSIKRPVVCVVASIFIVLVGGLLFLRLPVREYPNIDSPIVSVEVSYPGVTKRLHRNRPCDFERRTTG